MPPLSLKHIGHHQVSTQQIKISHINPVPYTRQPFFVSCAIRNTIGRLFRLMLFVRDLSSASRSTPRLQLTITLSYYVY